MQAAKEEWRVRRGEMLDELFALGSLPAQPAHSFRGKEDRRAGGGHRLWRSLQAAQEEEKEKKEEKEDETDASKALQMAGSAAGRVLVSAQLSPMMPLSFLLGVCVFLRSTRFGSVWETTSGKCWCFLRFSSTVDTCSCGSPLRFYHIFCTKADSDTFLLRPPCIRQSLRGCLA